MIARRLFGAALAWAALVAVVDGPDLLPAVLLPPRGELHHRARGQRPGARLRRGAQRGQLVVRAGDRGRRGARRERPRGQPGSGLRASGSSPRAARARSRCACPRRVPSGASAWRSSPSSSCPPRGTDARDADGGCEEAEEARLTAAAGACAAAGRAVGPRSVAGAARPRPTAAARAAPAGPGRDPGRAARAAHRLRAGADRARPREPPRARLERRSGCSSAAYGESDPDFSGLFLTGWARARHDKQFRLTLAWQREQIRLSLEEILVEGARCRRLPRESGRGRGGRGHRGSRRGLPAAGGHRGRGGPRRAPGAISAPALPDARAQRGLSSIR